MTEEWVSADSEIWGFDYNDDFIWLPADDIDGVGTWIAKTQTFTYVAEKETFIYVAKRSN